MRKFFSILAVTLAALAAPQAEAQSHTSGDVNLRTGPGKSYARIGTIPGGTPVSVVQCLGSGWCEVLVGGHHGWASGRYIRYAQPVIRPVTVIGVPQVVYGVRSHAGVIGYRPAYWAGQPVIVQGPGAVRYTQPVVVQGYGYGYVLP